MKFIQSVIGEVRSSSTADYTPEDLKEELDAMTSDFFKKFKNALTMHSELLANDEGRKAAISAIQKAETEIEKLKGLLCNEDL